MADDLNREEIALMCDIVQSASLHLTPRKIAELSRLTEEGYIEITNAPGVSESSHYRVTRKGQKVLDERGVGATES